MHIQVFYPDFEEKVVQFEAFKKQVSLKLKAGNILNRCIVSLSKLLYITEFEVGHFLTYSPQKKSLNGTKFLGL